MSKYLSAEELALATGPGGTILLIISETDDTILHPPGSAKVSFLQCVPLAAMRGAGSNHLNSMAKHEKYKNDSHRPLGSETSMMEAIAESSLGAPLLMQTPHCKVLHSIFPSDARQRPGKFSNRATIRLSEEQAYAFAKGTLRLEMLSPTLINSNLILRLPVDPTWALRYLTEYEVASTQKAEALARTSTPPLLMLTAPPQTRNLGQPLAQNSAAPWNLGSRAHSGAGTERPGENRTHSGY